MTHFLRCVCVWWGWEGGDQVVNGSARGRWLRKGWEPLVKSIHFPLNDEYDVRKQNKKCENMILK